MQSLPQLLGDSAWDQLRRSMKTRTFQPGESIVAQGDLAPDFHVIEQGTAAVVATTIHGEEHELGRLHAGDCIGEMSLLTGDPASAKVVAISPASTWSASQGNIADMGEMRGRLLAALSSILAERLRHANERVLSRHATNIVTICGSIADIAALAGLPAAIARATGERTVLIPADDQLADTARLIARDAPSVDVHTTDDQSLAATLDRLTRAGSQPVVLCDESSSALALVDPSTIFHILRPGTGRIDASAHAPGGKLVLISDDPWTVPSLAALSTQAGREVVVILRKSGDADLDRIARVLTRRTVGIAFGAGAAKGFAHLGVLRAFREFGIPIDAVSGASIGAAVAAGVAAGTPIDELEQLVNRVADRIVRPTVPLHSLLSNAGVKEELQKAAGETRIEDLNLPLAIVAVDLFRRAEVTFTSGLVWPRILASTAIPGVYPPVAALGSFLVDGGILTPVPARQCRDLGADIVIGVRLTATRTSPREQLDRKPGKPLAVESMIRAFEIMQNRISEISHEPSDVTIEITRGRHRRDAGLQARPGNRPRRVRCGAGRGTRARRQAAVRDEGCYVMMLLALRNLVSEKTRFAFSAAGIGFAVFLITVLIGLYQGWNQKVGGFVEDVETDLWVAREGTTDFINAASILSSEMGAELEAMDGVAAVHPLIVRPMQFFEGDKKVETHLIGYDVASGVGGPLKITKGEGDPGAGEIVIDEVLSQTSGVGVGDILTSGDTQLTVIGIASGGNFAFTQAGFMDIEAASELLSMGDLVTFWLVDLEEGADPAAVSAAILADHDGTDRVHRRGVRLRHPSPHPRQRRPDHRPHRRPRVHRRHRDHQPHHLHRHGREDARVRHHEGGRLQQPRSLPPRDHPELHHGRRRLRLRRRAHADLRPVHRPARRARSSSTSARSTSCSSSSAPSSWRRRVHRARAARRRG